MRGPPVVLTNTLGRPVTNVINGAVPMVVVNTLGEPVTLVNSGGEPVTLFNADGTTYGDLARLIALSPSLLIWPAEGAGWQGTSGGTLAASGQPLGLGADLSQLGGKTLSEAIATATSTLTNLVTQPNDLSGAGWLTYNSTVSFSGGVSTVTRNNAQGDSNALLVYFNLGTSAAGIGWLQCQMRGVGGSIGRTVLLQQFDNNGAPTTETTTLTSDWQTPAGATGMGSFANARIQFGAGTLAIGEAVEIRSVFFGKFPGNHLRAGTWASPSNSARGTFQNNAINFDGVNDYYSLLNAISITTNMTVVRAFKRASAGIHSVGLATSSTFYSRDFYWVNDNTRQVRFYSGATSASANTFTGSFVSTSIARNGTQLFRINAAEIASGSGSTTNALSALGLTETSRFNSGEISFVAVFPDELTGANLALVEQIAAATNGATLS